MKCAQCKKEYKHGNMCVGCPKCAPNVSIAEEEFVKPITVHGWVWKNKMYEDCYVPSYTPAQPFAKGELFALVDPTDLHQPLENTQWHYRESK